MATLGQTGVWVPSDGRVIAQAITDTFTPAANGILPVPVGTTVAARDTSTSNNQGECWFTYAKGVASTAIGDLVKIDSLTPGSTRTVAGTRGAVGVAMSANVAGQYGWYQVGGVAIVKSATVVSGARVYLTATAGQVDDAVVAGDAVDGARFASADGTPSAGFAMVQLSSPFLNGNG